MGAASPVTCSSMSSQSAERMVLSWLPVEETTLANAVTFLTPPIHPVALNLYQRRVLP